MIRLPEYNKPVADYKPEAALILNKPTYVQEKLDGSQFTFAYIEGNFYARSRGQQLSEDVGIADLFANAYLSAKELCLDGILPPGFLYRCEAFKGPKHNSLKYDRAPKHGFVVYDVQSALNNHFVVPVEMSDMLDGKVEYVKVIGQWPEGLKLRSELVDFLDANQNSTSMLGGPIEGFVFKEYSCSPDRAVVKVVREQFKELHALNEEYIKIGPTNGLERVMEKISGPARYLKALSHLRESGASEGSMRDMPKLLNELHADLDSDHGEIKDLLWQVFGGQIKKNLGKGLALWLKDQLRAE